MNVKKEMTKKKWKRKKQNSSFRSFFFLFFFFLSTSNLSTMSSNKTKESSKKSKKSKSNKKTVDSDDGSDPTTEQQQPPPLPPSSDAIATSDEKTVPSTTSVLLPLANDDDNATVALDKPLVTPRPHVVESNPNPNPSAVTVAEALEFGHLAEQVARVVKESESVTVPHLDLGDRDGVRSARLFELAGLDALADNGVAASTVPSLPAADSPLGVAQIAALSLIAQLAAHPPNVDLLVRRGALAAFLRQLRAADDDVVRIRLGALGVANLAASAYVKRTVADLHSVVPPLLFKALYTDDRDSLFQALRAFRRFAELPANRDHLAAAGLVTHVCGQVAVAKDDPIVYEAMGIMSNLARSAAARKALCNEKGAHVLVAVLARHADSPKLGTRALEALFRIAVDADGQRICGSANAVEIALHALAHSTTPDAKLTAISLLHRLLREPSNGAAFASARGTERLWPWLESYFTVPRLANEARDILKLIGAISPAQAKEVAALLADADGSNGAAATATASTSTTTTSSSTAATAAPKSTAATATSTSSASATPKLNTSGGAGSVDAAKEVAAAVMSPHSPLFSRKQSGRSQNLLASLAAQADAEAARPSAKAARPVGGATTAATTAGATSKTLPSSMGMVRASYTSGVITKPAAAGGAGGAAFAGLVKPKQNTGSRALLKQFEDEAKAELDAKDNNK
jgi:hypothetical protein